MAIQRYFAIATFSLLTIGITGIYAQVNASAATPTALEPSSRAPLRRQILRRSVTRPSLSPVSSPSRRPRNVRRFQPRSRQTSRPSTGTQRRSSTQRRQTNSPVRQSNIRPTAPRSRRARQSLTKQFLIGQFIGQSSVKQFQAQSQLSCDDPQNQQELNRCAFQTLTQENQRLNDTYRGLFPNLSEQRQQLLRNSQVAWVAYRDRECRFYDSSAEGGSLQPLLSSGCKARLTRDRTRLLQRYRDGLGSPAVPAGDRISETQRQRRYQQVQNRLAGFRNGDYGELRSRLLRNSEQAWQIYRNQICGFERAAGGNAALTTCRQWQTNQRYIQLAEHLGSTL
ncbi:MAG: lysozyme inhibitor LprI family protein [Cyanophyceae cyanobacterium]